MVVCMEKYAWRGKIVPGMQEEYKKRHDNIWPEMKEVLANAGIVNYSIWMQGEELFGYYECEKGVDYAAKVQAESDVVKKWDEYMLLPHGRFAFVEVKAPNQKPRPLQLSRHRLLRRLGFQVYVLDALEDIDKIIKEVMSNEAS